jgi:hypothetical protein
VVDGSIWDTSRTKRFYNYGRPSKVSMWIVGSDTVASVESSLILCDVRWKRCILSSEHGMAFCRSHKGEALRRQATLLQGICCTYIHVLSRSRWELRANTSSVAAKARTLPSSAKMKIYLQAALPISMFCFIVKCCVSLAQFKQYGSAFSAQISAYRPWHRWKSSSGPQ